MVYDREMGGVRKLMVIGSVTVDLRGEEDCMLNVNKRAAQALHQSDDNQGSTTGTCCVLLLSLYLLPLFSAWEKCQSTAACTLAKQLTRLILNGYVNRVHNTP